VIETVLINCHYPVTADSFVLQWGVSVKKLPDLPVEKADLIAAKLAKSFGVGFLQDVEIWRNKTAIDNPLQRRPSTDAAFEEQTAAIPDKTLDLAGEIAMTIERRRQLPGQERQGARSKPHPFLIDAVGAGDAGDQHGTR